MHSIYFLFLFSGIIIVHSSFFELIFLLFFFHQMQVSFFSTSPELSNKQRFEYFSRTIPSDHYQVKAMVDIVRRMGWSYISIIYEESNYGIKVSFTREFILFLLFFYFFSFFFVLFFFNVNSVHCSPRYTAVFFSLSFCATDFLFTIKT